MTKYIIKRLIGMIPTLFIIVTLSFFIVRIAPGGPFDGERALPEAVKRNIEAKYHMDEPLLMQYGRYMFDVVRGDLGPSYKYKDYDVNTLIGVSLPNSIVLGSFAMVVALIFGISLLFSMTINSCPVQILPCRGYPHCRYGTSVPSAPYGSRIYRLPPG